MIILVSALQLVCCGDICPSKYVLELPKPPESWVSLLGEPCWRIEWLTPNGEGKTADLHPGEGLEVEIPTTWANPVIARPYWERHNLGPGIFMPAGALFPFDVKNGVIRLSWAAGHDAVFYDELSIANNEKPAKIPANFDWIRFREFFQSDALGEDVRKDPWLIDWRSVAEKTISGNFDKRRFVPEKTEIKKIPVPYGTWYGTSPFAEPLSFENGESSFVESSFPIRPGFNVWVNKSGILRVSGNIWIFSKLDL